MKNSTFSAQVANNLLTLLQGYSKTIRLLLVMFLTLTVTTNAWGAEYSYTFSAKQFSANGSKTLNNVSWTLAGDGGYWGYDGTKGQQFGSGNKPYKTLTLSTSGISGTITKIIINTSGGSSVNASFTVSVGGTQWGNSTKLTATATAYTFTGSNSGEMKFSYTQTSSKALYIKSIIVTYETTAATVPVTGVSLDKTKLTLTEGSSETLTATVLPNNATDKTITWSTSNSSVATVSDGKVTAVAEGSAIITVTTNDGKKTATCNVTVNPKPKYTVTLVPGSGTCAASVTESSAGAGVTLPTPTLDGCGEWSFAGWTTSSVANETSSKPATLLTGTYKPTANTTLYAVYQRTEETEGNGGTEDVSRSYTFSQYTAGAQYAENEVHKLDNDVTLTTTDCHFTSELRIYSSSTNNGYVVSNKLPGRIVSIGVNAGNKSDNLLVYGSTDGSAWTQVGSIAVTSTYKDYTLSFGETNYTYFKLDVEGSNQVRLKSITITWESTSAGGTITTTYYHSTPDCGGSTPDPDPIYYTITLNPNYPEGKKGTFIDTVGNAVDGDLKISWLGETKTTPIANLYSSISLDGYIFEGWYEITAEGEKNRKNTGTITRDTTFYARWKEPYTVTFNAGTGECDPQSITETTADGIKLPTATLTDCGDWTFLGWAETAIESETTDAPASILAGGSTYKPTDDIILYAIYKRVKGGGSGEEAEATLSFADKAQRTTYTTNQQIWEQNGITLTNNKASSTSNVGDYANPARFYAKSKIIISAPANINKIVANCSKGASDLVSSVGAEASNSNNAVTIVPTSSNTTYTIAQLSAQVQMSSITVTYGGSPSTSYYHSTPNCQVTITYYGFGGGYTTDCETDPVIVITKGDTYQIPNCEPTDYDNTLNRTFAGTWNTKANGKGTAYKPGEEFIVNSDIILYAQWALNTESNITLPTDVEDLANTDIVVNGGNTLTLQAGTTTINSLTLKGGLQENGTYAMPVVNIPNGATLVRNNNKINLDLKVNNNSYYPFAVPFEVANTSDNVNYINPTLKAYANAINGYGTYYRILEYNGALRAENGVNSAENWVQVGRTGVKLMPGKGYAISAVPASGQDTVTIRITMTVDNAWLADGEQESIIVKEQTTTRNKVTVTAYTGDAATEHQRHAGWNFVANPYLSKFAGGNVANDVEYIKGSINIQNEYTYEDTEVTYVTVPAHDFSYYEQFKLSTTKLSPAYSFFVQVGGTGGTMTFETAGRQQAPASIAARNAEERPVKMDVDITLSDNHSSDQTGIIISDRYSEAYEIGRDLEKLFGSAYNLSVYTLMADNTPLAFQALAIRSNMQVIPVGYRAPEQGEYTFRLNEATSSIDLLNEQYEQLVLVDYQTGELTNLLISDYTFYSERTQADNRFAIYAVPRQNAPTDLPNAIGQDKQAQKIIHNGHLYILRDGNVYNGNGQIVK